MTDLPRANEKEELELEKLRAEIANLKRPFYRQTAVVVTALIGLAGFIVQYTNSDRAYQLAEIKREQTNLDIDRMNVERRQLDSIIGQLRAVVTAMKARRATEETRLAEVQKSLAAARVQLKTLTPASAAAQATKSIDDAITVITDFSASKRAEGNSFDAIYGLVTSFYPTDRNPLGSTKVIAMTVPTSGALYYRTPESHNLIPLILNSLGISQIVFGDTVRAYSDTTLLTAVTCPKPWGCRFNVTRAKR